MKSQPTNILFIASNSIIAGGENYLFSVIRHLDRERFNPIVMVPGDGDFYRELIKQGIEAFVLDMNYFWLAPPDEWYRHLSDLPIRVRKLTNLIREKNISLVHTNSNIILEGALAARLAGVHHLFFAHLEYLPQNPIYQRLTLDASSFAKLMGDLSTHIIAVSQSVAQSYCPPLNLERIQVINNGLELEKFDHAVENIEGNLRPSLGLPKDAIIIAGVGRINPDKGFDFYIESAGLVIPENPNVHFLLVGKDEDLHFSDAIRKRVKQLNIGANFHFLGQRGDIPAILAETDIFVLSSRFEGHPFVLLEAMGCACACVATRCGGVEETITSDTGLIVDVGDIHALTSAIIKLVDDSDLRNKMGISARARIKANFSAKTCIQSLATAYDAILSMPAPTPGSYIIDFFLQAVTEYGYLGNQIVQFNERIKNLENLANKLWKNPLYQLIKKLIRR